MRKSKSVACYHESMVFKFQNCWMLFTASKWPSPRLSCQCKGGCLVDKARGQRRVVGAEQRCAPFRDLPRNAPLPRPLGLVQDGLRQVPRVDVRQLVELDALFKLPFLGHTKGHFEI